MKKTAPEDDETPRLPIPTQIVSNGEYLPLPQTPKQKQVDALVQELADRRARKLGMKRRDFLRTAAGTATVMFAMNQIYGCGSDDGGGGGGNATATPTSTATPSPTATPFNVCEADTTDPERAREIFDAEFFVMDVQTHHVDLDGAWYPALKGAIAGLRFRDFAPCNFSDTDCKLTLITRENYIREMFVESETAVGVMSGVPPGAGGILPNDTMAETRDEVNQLANSQRMLAQMLCEPTLAEGSPGRTTIFDIERNVQELGSVALKCYPGSDRWWLDDEEVAYPMYERAVQAGLDVVSVHKGFPGLFGAMAATYVQSIDIPKAARDWPDLKFVIYHSGYYPAAVQLPGGNVIPAGIEQFASILEANPDITNVYAEIGSTFASTIAGGGIEAMEILGRLLKAIGPERIIWGTDSVWWGSPQWQIDALKAFQISEQLQEQKGYPALTDEIRAKILGLNAARLYGVDVEATRCTLAEDAFAVARAERLQAKPLPVAQPHGPRTRREFLQLSALEQRVESARRGS